MTADTTEDAIAEARRILESMKDDVEELQATKTAKTADATAKGDGPARTPITDTALDTREHADPALHDPDSGLEAVEKRSADAHEARPGTAGDIVI